MVPGFIPPIVLPIGNCIIPPSPPLELIGTPPIYNVFPETKIDRNCAVGEPKSITLSA